MQRYNKLIILIAIFAAIASILFLRLPKESDIKQTTNEIQYLQIISTSPSPLDEATILPTQAIEITFNKPIFRSEFKHKFDPEVDHDVEVVNEENQEYGKLLRIVFKKPLEFGSGYTLFIEQNTHSEDKQTLEKNYQYHFKTIKYSGI